MTRSRDSQLAIKTTSEIKEKLNALTDSMSKSVGYRMTQTQVIEKLISDACKQHDFSDEEDTGISGYFANNAALMALADKDLVEVRLKMQQNANRLAGKLHEDIIIDDVMNHCQAGTDTNRMFEVLHSICGNASSDKFSNKQTAKYYGQLSELIKSYSDLHGIVDHPFVILKLDGREPIAVGSSFYVGSSSVAPLKRMFSTLRSLLTTMLGIVSEEKAFDCTKYEFVVKVLSPKDSLYVPDVGDEGPCTCTVCLFLSEYENLL